jgi:hypothetical protein
MVFRATNYLCALLAAAMPVVTCAQVMEHAHEHHEAELTGHGHSHEDSDVPHHEHEEDGAPIPADKSPGMVRVAPPTLAKLLVQPAEPAPFTARFTDVTSLTQLLLCLLNLKDDFPPLSIPSPGDTLPLLI